ncbi:MAG: hypothetical protein CV087_21795 [Candidatus Brocadia sp. WS118]|nr:MAG: hypothetical protein CV087_21795 [Candidatus Brocadia sp. WS118]
MLHTIAEFLPVAERVYDRKAFSEILKHLCVRDGYLLISDKEYFARLPVNDDRSYTIPVEALQRMLKARPRSLEIKQSGRNIELCFDQKRIRYESEDVDKYQKLPDEKFQPLGVWSKDVLLKLHKQMSFTSDNQLKPVLEGIYLHQNEGLESCATDGHVLEYFRDLDPDKECKLTGDLTAVIPKKGIQLLSKLAYGNVKVEGSKNYLRFTCRDKLELYIPLIPEEFVDFQRVLHKKLLKKIRLKRDDLLRVVKYAKPVRHDTLILTAQNGTLEVFVDNREADISFESCIPIKRRSGEVVKFGFNLKLLEKTLKALEGDEITWRYNSCSEQSLFQTEQHKLNIIMPINLEKTE